MTAALTEIRSPHLNLLAAEINLVAVDGKADPDELVEADQIVVTATPFTPEEIVKPRG